MATDRDFIEFLEDQTGQTGPIRYRKMFGEYAVYFGAKIVALVCDNQIFVKPTQAGQEFLGEITEAPPYPGAKPYYLIDERFEDREWFCELLRITADSLPPPKPKKRKS